MSTTPSHPGAAALLRRLHENSYFALLSLLGDGVLRPYDWEKMSPKLAGDTQALWKFFLLGEKLPRHDAVRLVGEPALEFLRVHKLCRVAGGKVSLRTLALVSYLGHAFFVDRQAPVRVTFGNDARALLTMGRQPARGACLCLHPASGAEALPLLTDANLSVDLWRVDYHRGIIAANLALNAVAANWRFLKSQKQCQAGGYELVLGCIPSYFETPGLKLPREVAAGADGLVWVREALALGAKALAPDGEMLLTFLLFAEPRAKALEEQLHALLGKYELDYSVIVSSRLLMEPGLPVFNQMAALAAKAGRVRPKTVFDKLLKHIQHMKFGAVYLVRGRFTRPARPARRQLVDYSELYYGGWTF